MTTEMIKQKFQELDKIAKSTREPFIPVPSELPVSKVDVRDEVGQLQTFQSQQWTNRLENNVLLSDEE